MHAFTRIDPGSDMMGVPASLTNAMDLAGDQNVISPSHFFSSSTRPPTRLASFS